MMGLRRFIGLRFFPKTQNTNNISRPVSLRGPQKCRLSSESKRDPSNPRKSPLWFNFRLKMLLLLGATAPIICALYDPRIKELLLDLGSRVTKSPPPVAHKRLTDDEVDKILRKNEWDVVFDAGAVGRKSEHLETIMNALSLGGQSHHSPQSSVVSCHVDQVRSNAVIEDTYSHNLSEKGIIFGVFDGHSGTECSATLKRYLGHYVASDIGAISQLLSGDERRNEISEALKRSFRRLDHDIVYGGITTSPGLANSESGVDILSSLAPALSGSCALLVYIENDDAYFANAGDSRAVIGRMLNDQDFRFIQATFDQTAENSKEYSRLISEHPNETSDILYRNRILGCLQPTRAFGDAKYKYPLEIMDKLVKLGLKVPFINKYLTPPYLTADPVVTYHKIDPEVDKFIVIASDGVYDRLTNEEVVHLTGKYLQKNIKRQEGFKEEVVDGRIWQYKDNNAATHIIRNALAYGEPGLENRLLAVKPPAARDLRDDMTAVVVFLGGERDAKLMRDMCSRVNGRSKESCISSTPCKGVAKMFHQLDKSLVKKKQDLLEDKLKSVRVRGS